MKDAIIILILFLTSCVEQSNNDFLTKLDTETNIKLIRRNDRCGEWGGDLEIINIYKKGNIGLYADYSISTSPCDHPELSNDPTNNFQKTSILLDDKSKEFIIKAINELVIVSKDSNEGIPYPAHSGIRNQIITSDSLLTIDEYPSIQWTAFDQLISDILN